MSPLTAVVASFASCAKPQSQPNPSATVDALADEAGFIDVPPQAQGSPFPARMFYVFEAADGDAAGKPLAVFMAGGPGYPSSLDLLPYGTARATLTSPTAPGVPPAPNSASWTSFANLLFIDERQSGFSYEYEPDDTSAPAVGDGGVAFTAPSTIADAGDCSFTPVGDAADFVRVILAFLDTHPAVRAAPVILVGQSYGGERATLILDLLLRYSTEAPLADATLGAAIQAHYDAVFPERAGTIIDAALGMTQFGHVVLLQPFVLGGLQYTTQAAVISNDPYVGEVPASNDPYDVRKAIGWSQDIDDTGAIALASLPEAASLLALDPPSIPRMGPPARDAAFRVTSSVDAAQVLMDDAWTEGLGALDANDRYLVYPATACSPSDSLYTEPGSQDAFLANLQGGVRTFITDARYDAVIYAPAIPATLQSFASVTIDAAPRAGVARPGWFTVTFAPDAGTATSIEVRFPPYDDSGHFVALAQSQALHDDVAEWLLENP